MGLLLCLFVKKTSRLGSQHSSYLFYNCLACSWFPVSSCFCARNRLMTMLCKDIHLPEKRKYLHLNILQFIEIIKMNRSYYIHLLITTSFWLPFNYNPFFVYFILTFFFSVMKSQAFINLSYSNKLYFFLFSLSSFVLMFG